jgi:hypothetical protein
MEVAGIALGALPLIVSAAENYAKVYRKFSRFRKYDAEIRGFLHRLLLQKTIFRTECRLLITLVAGEEDV